MESERSEFEAWAVLNCMDGHDRKAVLARAPDGTYVLMSIHLEWTAWQASRANSPTEAKLDAVRDIVQDYAVQPSARLRRIVEIVK